jgi:stage V sporulation protein SpoVS
MSVKVIDVTGNSDSAIVAVALAYGARHEGRVEMKGEGMAAAMRMVAAIGAAQEYLVSRGTSLIASVRAENATDDLLGPVRLMVSVGDDTTPDPEDTELRELESEVLAEIAEEAEIDEQIAEDFAERQELPHGENRLLEDIREHTADSPILSGGDLDAAWEMADVGDETVGGTAVTPDQDRVDLLGEAVGLTYDDDEPLNTDRKLERRDEHRWELDPRSAADDDLALDDERDGVED